MLSRGLYLPAPKKLRLHRPILCSKEVRSFRFESALTGFWHCLEPVPWDVFTKVLMSSSNVSLPSKSLGKNLLQQKITSIDFTARQNYWPPSHIRILL